MRFLDPGCEGDSLPLNCVETGTIGPQSVTRRRRTAARSGRGRCFWWAPSRWFQRAAAARGRASSRRLQNPAICVVARSMMRQHESSRRIDALAVGGSAARLMTLNAALADFAEQTSTRRDRRNAMIVLNSADRNSCSAVVVGVHGNQHVDRDRVIFFGSWLTATASRFTPRSNTLGHSQLFRERGSGRQAPVTLRRSDTSGASRRMPECGRHPDGCPKRRGNQTDVQSERHPDGCLEAREIERRIQSMNAIEAIGSVGAEFQQAGALPHLRLQRGSNR